MVRYDPLAERNIGIKESPGYFPEGYPPAPEHLPRRIYLRLPVARFGNIIDDHAPGGAVDDFDAFPALRTTMATWKTSPAALRLKR